MWLLPAVFVFDNVLGFGSCLPNSRKIRLLWRLPMAVYITYFWKWILLPAQDWKEAMGNAVYLHIKVTPTGMINKALS